MKYKITDLMDLYEDQNCSLPPRAEQDGQAADNRLPEEYDKEVMEVKQSKHAFGWQQLLSLAAALALVVLGGFGVKKLMDRNGLQTGAPGQAQSTEQIPQDTNDVVWLGWEEITGTERESVSRFLTAFAQQGVESMEELDTDAELIRFAFIYRRIYDPESITVQPDADNCLWDSLTPEQVNETLEALLGRSVTPDETADYNLIRSIPEGGHCSYHDGYFWQEPSGNDLLLRFALATHVLNSRSGGELELRFTVYAVDIMHWPLAELDPLPALSAEEAEALTEEGKLVRLLSGAATLRQTEDGYRLERYETKPAEEQQVDPAPSESEDPEPTYSVNPFEVNTLLSAFAEQGITDSELDLAGEYELAQFAHIYTKLHDPDAIRYQSEGGESWETLTLAQVNGALTALLDKTLSPAEGTDYTAQRGDNYAQHESFHDGCFWWPAADGDMHTRFAIFDDRNYSMTGHGTETVHFLLLEAVPENWPEWESVTPAEINTTEMLALAAEEKLLMVSSSGQATIRWNGAIPQLISYRVNYRNDVSYVMDSTLYSTQQDPDGFLTAREIRFRYEGEFSYREGDPDSEYSYWCSGSWRKLENGLRLDYVETDEEGRALGEPQWAIYSTEYDENSVFHMTLTAGTGLGRDALGWTVLYDGVPTSNDDSAEDLNP